MKRFVKHECPGFATGGALASRVLPGLFSVAMFVLVLIGEKLTKLRAITGNYVVTYFIEPEHTICTLLMSKKY